MGADLLLAEGRVSIRETWVCVGGGKRSGCQGMSHRYLYSWQSEGTGEQVWGTSYRGEYLLEV